jgi:hypothetical protein
MAPVALKAIFAAWFEHLSMEPVPLTADFANQA